MKPVLVVCGVLRKDGKILLCRRGPKMKRAGLWEFPGGKVDAGEAPAAALARELREELGLRGVVVGPLVARGTHAYGDVTVELQALEVQAFEEEPAACEHDRLAWVAPADLAGYPLTDADVPIARALA